MVGERFLPFSDETVLIFPAHHLFNSGDGSHLFDFFGRKKHVKEAAREKRNEWMLIKMFKR